MDDKLDAMQYREQLSVPVGYWCGLMALAASFVVAVWAVLGQGWGFASLVVLCGIVAALLWWWGSSTITVDDRAVSIGRNSIDFGWLNSATVSDATESKKFLSSHQATKCWLRTRPWLAQLVVIELNDPADPHTCWVLSSRTPRRLAAAINAGIAATKAEDAHARDN